MGLDVSHTCYEDCHRASPHVMGTGYNINKDK